MNKIYKFIVCTAILTLLNMEPVHAAISDGIGYKKATLYAINSDILIIDSRISKNLNEDILEQSIEGRIMEKSNYDSVRSALKASGFVNAIVGLPIISSTPVVPFVKIASNVLKVSIYIEDWLHTDREIQNRIDKVLSSAKLVNAANSPEVYSQFEKYVKTSLQRWVPDRDYPQIGYLPKELLYDKDLGEKDIIKYWPEAKKREQATYVALTFDELVLNYEMLWNDLSQNGKKIPKS